MELRAHQSGAGAVATRVGEGRGDPSREEPRVREEQVLDAADEEAPAEGPETHRPRKGTHRDGEAARRVADDAYAKDNKNLQLTTAGLCGSGTVGAFIVGGVSLGASFAFGSAGALFYVQLLSRKAESGGGGQGGPPSILVPVILFMALNRWNTFYADDVGVALAPIPMLLGFFTYKPASVFQAFRDILEEENNEEDVEYVTDPYGDEEQDANGSGVADGSSSA